MRRFGIIELLMGASTFTCDGLNMCRLYLQVMVSSQTGAGLCRDGSDGHVCLTRSRRASSLARTTPASLNRSTPHCWRAHTRSTRRRSARLPTRHASIIMHLHDCADYDHDDIEPIRIIITLADLPVRGLIILYSSAVDVRADESFAHALMSPLPRRSTST